MAIRLPRFAQNALAPSFWYRCVGRSSPADKEEQRHAEDVSDERRVAQELTWASCRSWRPDAGRASLGHERESRVKVDT
jgi:hypothetical protein